MADLKHIELVKQNYEEWNEWRRNNPEVQLDFSRAELRETDLNGKDLSGANFKEATLFKAELEGANIEGANFEGANLMDAILTQANLTGSNLKSAQLDGSILIEVNFTEANLEDASLKWSTIWEANFTDANLTNANFEEANLKESTLCRTKLRNADLTGANLVKANFLNADMTNCRVYGVSAWGVNLIDTIQTNLLISAPDEPSITVDNLEVAQFIYLLTNNEKVRDVIDTITSKVVLILGRFSEERKRVLDSIRIKLRNMGYLPVLFDFEKPVNRDFTETVSTLAHLAKFIIADITEPRSIPQELHTIIPNLQVPVQPLLHSDSTEYGMFDDFRKYNWVLNILRYDSLGHLLDLFDEKVVLASEHKLAELKKSV